MRHITEEGLSLIKRFEGFSSSVYICPAGYPTIGYGHVVDALKLAKEMELNETKWLSLKTVLPLLSKPKYYMKTKYGYARGWEPVQYVERILTYYDILKQKNHI